MINVIIVDDHPVVREGIKQILAESADIMVTGEACDGFGLLSLLNQINFDVIVMDISMPGLSGLDLLQEIRTKYKNTPVLILSIYPDEQYGIRMIKAGADGYLSKNSAPKELVSAVHKIYQGHCYISAVLAERLALHFKTKTDISTTIEYLSDREYQVFLSIAEGLKPRQIANELSISIKTVETYRTRLMEKMGFKSATELIRYAFEHNLTR